MAAHEDESPVNTGTALDDDRRKFLAACGKFAVVTPPALTVLLSTSLNSKAIAYSGGRGITSAGITTAGITTTGATLGAKT